jgi:hypothetical protein
MPPLSKLIQRTRLRWLGKFAACSGSIKSLPPPLWQKRLLLISGYAELAEVGTGDSSLSILLGALLSISYGMGATLMLDEFALWLNLDAMAYWSRQGRESIDAVVLFGALLAIGTWGAPLFRRRQSPN